MPQSHVLLGLLELILLVLGGGSQGLLDQFLPDNLGSTKDVDIALDADQGWLNALLDWLFIGRVPLLVWLIIFLTLYSLSGFILQSILQTGPGAIGVHGSWHLFASYFRCL